jgi:hypothetical protein
MAFQTGSQVRPELADADLSGFARAGESIGAGLADVGAQIGQGIEKYKKKKQDAADDAAFAQAIEPYLMPLAGDDPDEAKAMAKFLRKDPAAFNAIQSLRKSQAEEEKNKVTQNILDQFSQGNINAQEAFSMGADPSSIAAVQGITEGQDAKKFNESVTLAAESVGGTYDPSQDGIVIDTNGLIPGGKKVIPLSDPMFANYFATAKGQTMTGRGFDVLGTMSDAEANTGAVPSDVEVPVESIASIPMAALVEYGQNPSMTAAGEDVAKGFRKVLDFFNKPVDKIIYTPGQGVR